MTAASSDSQGKTSEDAELTLAAQRLRQVGAGRAPVTMYTTSWCPDCEAAKRYLTNKAIGFVEVDIEQDEGAAELVMQLNGGRKSVPTLVVGDTAASLSNFSVAKASAFLAAVGLS